MYKKIFALFLMLIFFCNADVFALETKHPDFSQEFLGKDKFESFNRKMFNFNQKLNKYAIRPIHILWASIMPEYGMDRINGITNNIEFPIRLMSSLVQRDFTTAKNEGIRFFTNTIFGLGGMYDPAKRFLKIEPAKEDMEQALASCNVKSGPFFVLPVLSFTSLRGLFGKLLDTAFNPTSYIGSPIMAAVKAGLTINRTSYLQTLLTMVESTYADPYEITKKAYGINNYIKQQNHDRVDVTSNLKVKTNEKPQKTVTKNVVEKIKPTENEVKMEVASEIITPNTFYIDTDLSEEIVDNELKADINLPEYNPQNPVVDSMRTALFSIPEAEKSFWTEFSIWNRSFSKRIKTASINYTEGKDDYKYRYLLQKDKHAPVAVIYPSIGEGILSSHSVMLGKIFYDAGYSIIIQGSHFQWEFVKSMPDNYYPGLPENDAKILRELTAKIVNQLEEKNDCKFEKKVFIGTSLGAMASLFAGAQEFENNTLGDCKFISICPPPDLIYAIRQIDKQSEAWNKSPDEFKQKVASAAAKVVKLYQEKDNIKFEVNNLPFSEDEGKMITGFIMHQKLSDLIFTLEKSKHPEKEGIYEKINGMGYEDYAQKYLTSAKFSTPDELSYNTSLEYIQDYLEKGDNYKIYHSLNDYLADTEKLKRLKQITQNRTTILDNGAHLGFLYRKEFINDLKNTIALN